MNESKKEWKVVDGYYPGFLNIVGASYTVSIVTSATDLTIEDYVNRTNDAHLMAAAPDLLEALEKMIDNEEQMEFESWLEMKSPSGDCESVTDQWKESSYYLDFIDAINLQITAINKARGQQ